jgi:hypothetical protein
VGIITDRGRKNAQPLGSSIPLVAVSPTLLPQVDQGRAVVGVALHPLGAESNIVIDGVVLRAVSGSESLLASTSTRQLPSSGGRRRR